MVLLYGLRKTERNEFLRPCTSAAPFFLTQNPRPNNSSDTSASILKRYRARLCSEFLLFSRSTVVEL